MTDMYGLAERFAPICRTWGLPMRLISTDGRAMDRVIEGNAQAEDGGNSDGAGMSALCLNCAQRRSCRDVLYAGRIAAQTGIACIHRCAFGGVLISGAILRDEMLYAYVALGPFRMWDWDEYAREEITDLMREKRISAAHEDAVFDACAALKQLDSRTVRDVCQLVFDACAAASCENSYLSLERESYYVQNRLFDVVASEKRSGDESTYPIGVEQELLRRVRVGDTQGAKAILNELLGKIMFTCGSNTEVLKARALELVVVISRAAVEAGAELSLLLGMNYEFIGELSALQTFDEVCVWIARVLDKFLDAMRGARATPNMALLSAAASYISIHYAENITLEEVAGVVHVSPYRLSHMFRDELEITFIEYLTRTRIEKAKQLLSDGSLSITQIAHMVGYDDSGYFSRVFKKTTGKTPAAYRK